MEAEQLEGKDHALKIEILRPAAADDDHSIRGVAVAAEERFHAYLGRRRRSIEALGRQGNPYLV
jgi:hypothetical protein